jgi:hypothetical protein
MHPGLTQRERAEGEAMLALVFGTKAKKKTPPVPGGVGYGMFYKGAFRRAFARGTSFSYEIVCPNPPGGNIDTSLYVTATNRAHKGVEAFVAYQGQDDTRFKVFDWARPRRRSRHWQVDIAFANLTCPFRKFHPAWIRIVRQNHRILISDACDPACARNACR